MKISFDDSAFYLLREVLSFAIDAMEYEGYPDDDDVLLFAKEIVYEIDKWTDSNA